MRAQRTGWLKRRLRRRSQCSPASTWKLPKGEFGQQAAENNSISRHDWHFVMRDLFAVKTQYDDGDLSSVSPIMMPFERRGILRPVKML